MLRVAAFTGGAAVPSARFRVRQYIRALETHGVQLREFIAPISAYPPARRWLRPAWGAAALAASVPRVLAGRRHDVSLLQTLEPLVREPRILDVDDAIFLYREGRTAERLARLCETVICGNAYLAEWFSAKKKNVVVIPTAVDTDRYLPRVAQSLAGGPVLGWIGTSGNLEYLRGIEGSLRRALDAVPSARLRVVSDRAPVLRRLAPERVEFIPWSERSELAAIQGMDIGLMPLQDSPWARGKCSFKMLQYMACGLPVVVSPVGMNAEVLALGPCGLAASTEEGWTDALLALLEGHNERLRRGAEGRRIVEASFSIRAVVPQLARALRGA
jgi:glycosyltransferase involved in cell wall biosynthesis